jgi:hypothetical protein
LPENDRLMRAIAYNGSIDPGIWPYRKSQRTALAAIVQKCVLILRGVYGGKGYKGREEAFLRDVEQIARFDMRIQTLLLVQLKFPDHFLGNLGHEARMEAALVFEYNNHLWSSRVKNFSERAWYTLTAAKGKKSNKNIWRQIGLWVSAIGQVGSNILGLAGIIVLLLHIINVLVIYVVIIFLDMIISYDFAANNNENAKDTISDFGVILLVGPIFILLLGHIWIWMDGGIEVERLLVTGKTKLWYPITLLSMIIGYGILGGFALNAWFHLALPLSILITILGGLLCNVLQGWMSAFTQESMFSWLEKHPHGHVVLDEFQE